MTRRNQYIVHCVSTITDLMSGTGAQWDFEVSEVWVDNVSTAFTWSSGSLDIPTYTSGVVKVESILYLIYGELGGYHPKDPENPASDVVFWDDRVVKSPSFSTSINNIEEGFIDANIGALSFYYRDGWDDLITYGTTFINKTLLIYRESVLLYSGFIEGASVSRGAYTLANGNIDSVLDQECTFGDPDYMCRIKTDSSNSYYTGSNIDQKWDGHAIPMVFGPRTAWEDTQGETVALGQWVPVFPPILLPPPNTSSKKVGSGIILKVIPTSSTTGILCRTPSYETLGSTKTSAADDGSFFWTFTSTNTNMSIANVSHGQLVTIDSSNASRRTSQSCRVIGGNTSAVSFQLCTEDTVSADPTTDYDFYDYDSKSHLCSDICANEDYDDASTLISSTTITHGTQNNKLWTISVGSQVDLLAHDYYYVNIGITGSKSAPEVAEWILNSHGLTTDSSFATLGADLTEKATMHVGYDKEIQTVKEALSEINTSLLSYIKKPLNGSAYSMSKIDTSATPSVTLTNEDITNVRSNQKKGSTYGVVEFEHTYLQGDNIRDDVYRYNTSEASNHTGITKHKLINHVLNEADDTRFDEMTEFWCTPEIVVGFTLLDESISIDIGDYVQVNHEDFTGLLLITKLAPNDLGYSIQGRNIK